MPGIKKSHKPNTTRKTSKRNNSFSFQSPALLVKIFFAFALLFIIGGSLCYLNSMGQRISSGVTKVFANSYNPCAGAAAGPGGYCGNSPALHLTNGSASFLYQCSGSNGTMQSEEFCNNGCQINSSGSDYCKSGTAATPSTYNQCGSTQGACVQPTISNDHLVVVTQNAGSVSGNYLCVDKGPGTCAPPTPTPTHVPPTPTPPTGIYSCNAGGGGPGGGSCVGWWDVDNGVSPGQIGGISTKITMANLNYGNGNLAYFLYLVDHGNGRSCLDDTGSVWIRAGLVNPGGVQQGEQFDWDECPPNGHIMHHLYTTWIPQSDYGSSATFEIYQTDLNGGWNITGYDGSTAIVMTGSTNSIMVPLAWRMGGQLMGTQGASTNGMQIHFTNNQFCAWNNNCWSLGSNWQYYNGTNTNYQDDSTDGHNYPMRVSWVTVPNNSTTGGDIKSYIDLNTPPAPIPTPTPTPIPPTPTPKPSCPTTNGYTCVTSTNICSANGGVVHSEYSCPTSQYCCYFPPPTPTPTPTPATCQGQGGTCITGNSNFCNLNCNPNHTNACLQLNCSSGQLCCF